MALNPVATVAPGAAPAAPTLNQALPGLSGLTYQATNDIAGLLSGKPSPSYAQTTDAYAGASTGQPGQANALGTFIGNRGADLYNLQSQQAQQTGLGDLNTLINTASGTLGTSAAQQQQQGQFDANLALQTFMDQVNALSTAAQTPSVFPGLLPPTLMGTNRYPIYSNQNISGTINPQGVFAPNNNALI